MVKAAIACGHEVTADAAEAVLREGGTVADAVVAGAFAAMVAEPVLAGFLGGGFSLLTGDGAPACLDFFVQTPRDKRRDGDFREISADFGEAVQAFHIGSATIATPGVVPGLCDLHRRAGRMPLGELVAPAVAAAREGVVVTEFQAQLGGVVAPILTASEPVRHLFCVEGAPAPAGHLFRNPDFADVLDVFAAEGERFVTEGEVAQALLSLTREGGHLTETDLRRYRPIWRRPLETSRGATRLGLNPPPSLGGTLIALALGLCPDDPDPVAIAESLRATSRARLETGDAPEALLDPDLLARYRQRLEGRRVSTRGTTHISVIDAQGHAAAVTLSNGEGCGLIAPGTGIMPNNMLGEADLVPGAEAGDWLAWERETRLASMMCPMLCELPCGTRILLGSGGSNRIRSALHQVLCHLIDRGLSLEEAIAAPRLHVEGDRLDFEEQGLGEAHRSDLLAAFPDAKGWSRPSMFFGGVHAVSLTPGGALAAAGDPRRAGVARIL